MEKVTQLCATLNGVEDVRAELSLLRVSANAIKFAHLLRAAGPYLPTDMLDGFDQMQRAVLSYILGAKLSDRMWRQATTPAASGLQGMRQAAEIQFAPFIYSRAEARGFAAEVANAFPAPLKDVILKCGMMMCTKLLQRGVLSLVPP